MKRKIIVNNHFQQGDVIGRKLAAMPEGPQQKVASKRLTVMHGEGGHSHVVEDDEAELIRIGSRLLLKIEKVATIKHDEHKPITLSPGIWEVGQVREFDWFSRMERQVVD